MPGSWEVQWREQSTQCGIISRERETIGDDVIKALGLELPKLFRAHMIPSWAPGAGPGAGEFGLFSAVFH